jgi:hypothetical protein
MTTRLFTNLDLSRGGPVKVLEFLTIGLGEDIEKDSILASWPCRIRWTDEDTDNHIAVLDEGLTKEDNVIVIAPSRNLLTKGIYKVSKDHLGNFVLKDPTIPIED